MGKVPDRHARTPAPLPATPAPTVAREGFRGQLDGASLWDVVQIECQNRRREILRVTADSDVGYLFLAEGRIVHATTQLLHGSRAAMTILGWERGAFEYCELDWPERESIAAPLEQLLLEAACARDEEVARGEGPGRPATPPRQVRAAADAYPGGRRSMPEADGSAEIRLGPSGAVVRARGATEDLPPRVAYASRMAQVVGELLALQDFVALEASISDGHLIVRAEEDGGLSAMQLLPGAEPPSGEGW